jgi:hypothetical protein
MSDDSAKTSSGWTLAREHLGTVLAVGSAVLFGMRVLIVARFDNDVALAIVSTVTPTDFLRALVLPAAQLSVVFGTISLSLMAGQTWRRGDRPMAVALIAASFAIGFLALLFVLPPDSFFLPAVLISGFAFPTFQLAKERWFRVMTGSAVVLLVSAIVLADPSPWIPPERFAVGSHVVVGYTLKEGDDLVVLDDETRSVLRLDRSKVDREFCRTSDTDGYTLGDIWFGKPSVLPLCSTGKKP